VLQVFCVGSVSFEIKEKPYLFIHEETFWLGFFQERKISNSLKVVELNIKRLVYTQ
jgi:hypothetical protein